MTDIDRLLQEAFAAFQGGRLDEAVRAFDAVLACDPNRVDALLMRGLLSAEAGETQAAEALFQRCLTVSPGNVLALNHLGQLRLAAGERAAAVALFERTLARNPAFAPAWNNLGVALHGLGRKPAALAAFDRALALDAALLAVHGNRGQVLADMGRWPDALSAFRQALAAAPDSAAAWRAVGTACTHTNALAEAEDACRRAIAFDGKDVEAHIQLATILKRAGRAAESQAAYAAAARLQGVMVEPCLGGQPQARVLILHAQGGGNVPTKFLFDRQRFETVSIHLAPPGEDDAGLDRLPAELPAADIVFNAVGDGSADDPFLRQVTALLPRLGLPVLNPCERIPPTARDRLPALLAGIPNLLVPATRRVARAELEALAAGLPGEGGPPVLIRPAGAHGGEDLVKVHGAGELAAYLAGAPQAEFFATPFVDFRSADGFWRKYRFLFVDRRPYAYHLAIHDDWLIHYFRADMDHAGWMKAEEEIFLADWHSVFPAALVRAVEEAARRLDLDYGGMDCALTRDGRVVVFEANACMLLHLQDSPEEYPYKHVYVPRIIAAVGDMVLSRLGH